MLSLIQRPDLELKQAFGLTMAAAVAMSRAVEKVTGLRPLLKWPNDLFLEDRKLAGILTELKAARGRVGWAVVGIGLNVLAHPPNLEATDLVSHLGSLVDRFAILACFIQEHQAWRKVRPKELRQEWTRRSHTLGREVTVRDGEEEITGWAQGIDDQGALLIKTGKGLRRVVCGDLSVKS